MEDNKIDNFSLNLNDELIFNYYEPKHQTFNLNSLYNENELDFKKCELFKNYYSTVNYVTFLLSNTSIKLFSYKCNCSLTKYNINRDLISNQHLTQLLKKYKFDNPYFYSKIKKKDIYIKDNVIDIVDNKIEIKESSLDNYFGKLLISNNKLKEKYDKISSSIPTTYELISPNFNKYFDLNIDLNEEFIFFNSEKRCELFSEIFEFLEGKRKIIAISGPYGIGKSLSSLVLQKHLYLKQTKTLYINLKYYYKSHIEWNIKIETLISEFFFLLLEDKELKELITKVKQENSKNIWDYLLIIGNDLKKKEFQYLIILDQYQKSVDIEGNLKDLIDIANIKIFLLSSINYYDVKKQFELIILDKTPTIEYIYFINLLDNKKIISNEKIKEKILAKKGQKNCSPNVFFDNIVKILSDFGLFPKFIMLFLYAYSTIYDLIHIEYKKIFNKLFYFYRNNNNYSILKDITIDKPLIFSKEVLIKNFKNIPLKYFNSNSMEKNQSTFSISYAFPFCLNVYEDYINYRDAKNSFFISQDGGIKGTNFEMILKIRMKVFGSLQIDGHFEVSELLKMNLDSKYNNIDADYFTDKNNILITQKNSNGKLLDFIVFRPKESEVFWIQSKYIINSNNIQPRNNYVNQTGKFITTFKNKFGIELKNIYLLYISSEEYNIENSSEVFNLLEVNEINCLFYSVKKLTFSYDFIYEVDVLENKECYKINDNKNFNYRNQIMSQLYEMDSKFIGKKINNPNDKEYGNLQKVFKKLGNSSLEKKEHMKFIDYIEKENVFQFKINDCFGSFAFYNTNYEEMNSYFKKPIQAYYVNCVLENNEINFRKDIGIIFPSPYNQTKIYFDIKLKKEIRSKEYENKFRNLGFFYGEFIINQNNISNNIELSED